MPHFDQIGERGLDQVLAKRLITPGGSVAPTVAPELFPCVVLENDRPEYGFLKGELPFALGAQSNAPGAGAHATYVLSNGSQTSNHIAVVQEITTEVLCRVHLGTVSGTTTTVAAGIRRDGRVTANASSVVILGNILSAALPTRTLYAFPGVPLRIPLMVTPGTFVLIATNAEDTTLRCSCAWTERGLHPGERL